MKKIIVIFLISLSQIALASNAQMNETLVEIIDALEQLKILVNKAEHEQDKNPRFKVHFTKFEDRFGTLHNGLREDLNEIQKSLIDIVQQKAVAPRNIKPLENDFVG